MVLRVIQPTETEHGKEVRYNLRALSAVPGAVFQLGTRIEVLDLSENFIERLPPAIGSLGRLRDLCLNDNPLWELPSEMGNLTRLRALGLANTQIAGLPPSMCHLARLTHLDLRGTPLEIASSSSSSMSSSKGGPVVGAITVSETLRQLELAQKRDVMKRELLEKLSLQKYREIADHPNLAPLVEEVANRCQSAADLKDVVRHCNRLFPISIEADGALIAAHVLQELHQLKRELAMKRLAADLELKIKALYYDKLNPCLVESILRDIYAHIDLLEDMQFLIKRAPSIFPDSVEKITGESVRDSMLSLQESLSAERAACIEALFKSLSSYYMDQEPNTVRQITLRVAEAVKRGRFPDGIEIERLKQLAADCKLLFPLELGQVSPSLLKEHLLERERSLASASPPTRK